MSDLSSDTESCGYILLGMVHSLLINGHVACAGGYQFMGCELDRCI